MPDAGVGVASGAGATGIEYDDGAGIGVRSTIGACCPSLSRDSPEIATF